MDMSGTTSISKISQWLEERLHQKGLFDFLSQKTVPRHKHSIWYLFGGLTVFFFAVQLITGILLLVYYTPTPEMANGSVRFIMSRVPFGWLVRSVHSWSSHMMVVSLLIHLVSTYFMKAYRKPRELMWISGVLLFYVILGFAFTGYLLPWDTTAYFATQIGTEIPRSIPIVGEIIVKILKGGQFIGEESLRRFFALHVVVLPLMALGIISFHLILNQVHGTSVPIGTLPERRSRPFYPNYMYRDALAWIGGLMMLLTLASLFPARIGEKADLIASAPIGIRPEWYFLSLYQTLRMVPSRIFGLDGEMIVNMGVVTLSILLFSIPFVDAGANDGKKNRFFLFLGIAMVLYQIVSIGLAILIP